MEFLLASLGVLVLGGLLALVLGRSPRAAAAAGAGSAVVGCGLGILPAARVLLEGAPLSLRLPWQVPYGSFSIELDALSAFFLLPILCLAPLAAVYGGEYLLAFRERKALGPSWLFFNLLVASMALVVVARNGILFLVAWEAMALSSFFLVTFESEKASVREAGWTYLVATHLGTAFLLFFFALLGRESGSLDFDRLRAAEGSRDLLFFLALVGFGTKAGVMPLHVWLPEAHPAAPSHVSALLSGVMIKTGIYGLIRSLGILEAPAAWWGWLLIALGIASGVLGVLSALAQGDLKRLLAYSSVENMGVILIGLGLGLVGAASGSAPLLALGFGGALLHVLNHAVFKGLLFLGAGSVLHGAGTREIDRLGGLLKRMPWTGTAFLVGAAAIAGLPPLNGFAGEFLIFLGAFEGARSISSPVTVPAIAAVAGLGLIGGLAAACFARAFGCVFLGEPRGEMPSAPHEPGLAMRIPLALLALGCVVLGLLAPLVAGALEPVLPRLLGVEAAAVGRSLAGAGAALGGAVAVTSVLVALAVLLACLRLRLLAGRPRRAGPTWDCGYARPTPRMQYTGSSFVEPLTSLFAPLIRTRRRANLPAGPFPAQASLATHTQDLFRERIYRPAFAAIGWALARLRWLQHGQVQLYVLYIALTLLVLLVWKLGRPE